MEAWDPGLDPGELAGVGEGFCLVDGAQPLTQLRLTAKGGKSAQPSPKGRGVFASVLHALPSLMPCAFSKKDACHEPPLPPPPRYRRQIARRRLPPLRIPRRWLERRAAGSVFVASRRQWPGRGCGAQRRNERRGRLFLAPHCARLCLQSGVGGGADYRAAGDFRPADDRRDQGRGSALGAGGWHHHLHAAEYEALPCPA